MAAQFLGWRPAEFWAATPAELALALGDPTQEASAPVSLADFQHLLEREHDE